MALLVFLMISFFILINILDYYRMTHSITLGSIYSKLRKLFSRH